MNRWMNPVSAESPQKNKTKLAPQNPLEVRMTYLTGQGNPS